MSAADVAADVGSGLPVLAWVRGILSIAFVIALPFFIIGTSLRWLVTDRDFILQGFRENGVARVTGLDDAQLQYVATAFVQYFQAPPSRLDVQVRVNGQSRPLFNEREILHMEDVQGLVQWFLKMQLVGAAFILLRLVVAGTVERSARDVGRDAMIGAALLVALVVVVGVLSAIDFDGLWIRFHQIAFRNDMWMLDPRTDYLIMLFPEPFWFAGTVRLASAVAGGTLVTALAGFLAWKLGGR